MTQQSKSAQNSEKQTQDQNERQTPSLKDLIGFDLPMLTRHFTETGYYPILDCDKKELDNLKTAAHIANSTLIEGAQAVSDLLLTVEINCPDSVNKCSRIHALAPVYELCGALSSIDDMRCVLDRAQAVSEVAK